MLKHISQQDKLIALYTFDSCLEDDSLGRRGKSLARQFAQLDISVVLIESKVEKALKITQFVGNNEIEIETDHFTEVISCLALRQGNNNIFIVCSNPDVNAFGAIQRFKSCGWITIYDVNHDLEDMHRLKLINSYHYQVESAIARLVHGVSYVSDRLRQKIDAFKIIKKSTLIPNAIPDICQKYQDELGLQHTLCSRDPNAAVGYIGNLNPVWFDWPLIIGAANKLPDVKFEIIGYDFPHRVELPPNIKLTDLCLVDDIAFAVKSWKVGVLPLKENMLSLTGDLVAVYAYLSLEMKVVCAQTDVDHSSVYVYSNKDKFCERLAQALEKEVPAIAVSVNTEFLIAATWKSRAATFLEFIDEIKN